MTRQAPDGARILTALAGLALTAVALAGCTSTFLLDGGTGVGPTAEVTGTPSAAPTTTAEPDPRPDYDCDNLLINRPGNYVIGDCGTVTVEGAGIDLAFASIATLVVRGDGADLVGEDLGDVAIEGQRNSIDALSIGALQIRGEGNTVIVESTIDTVVVNGNENVVSAADGVGTSVDNGLLNEID